MTQPPECTNDGGVLNGSMPSDDCRDSNYVVGIGCVAHPEKETQGDNREQAHYVHQNSGDSRLPNTGSNQSTHRSYAADSK